MKVAIIGGGNMGSAFARALLEAKVSTPRELFVLEVDSARRALLSGEFGCEVGGHADERLSAADAWLLAIKPQEREACGGLLEFLRPEQVVVSIMAGVTLQTLSGLLRGHQNIVRSMPNLPLLVKSGMTIFIPYRGMEKGLVEIARQILEAGGAAIEVHDEDLLNAATAISGSGPGYVFYLIEHFCRAAEELGFSGEQAAVLVRETIAGAVKLWQEKGLSPEALRKMVTSKGGTTFAALEVMEGGRLGGILEDAIKAAYRRSKELAS